MPRKVKEPVWVLDPLHLHEASHTELVQIAQLLGHEHASRQMPTEELELLILGDEVHVEDPLDPIRKRIYKYVRGNSVLLSGLTCSTECMRCPHNRVVACFSRNSDKLYEDHEENPIPH